jgi:hypothetical protein
MPNVRLGRAGGAAMPGTRVRLMRRSRGFGGWGSGGRVRGALRGREGRREGARTGGAGKGARGAGRGAG